MQARRDRCGDQPFGRRADVEQEVAALRRHVDQGANQRARVFPVVVVGFEAPRIVHRHARFPIDAREPLRRHPLLGRAEVAEPDLAFLVEAAQPLPRVPHPVVDDQARPNRAHVGVEVASPLIAPVGDPVTVEPQDIDLGILCQQLPELGLHVGLDVAAEVGVAPGARVVVGEVGPLGVGVVPIHDRVVDAEPEPGAMGGLRQGLDRVALVRCRVHDVVARDLRVEDREAVVVLGRDDDVLHTGVLGDADPLLGIEAGRVEAMRVLLVLRDRDVRPRHDPLADPGDPLASVRPGRHGVDAPVNEHPEPRLAPPRHARVALRRCFFGGGLRGGRQDGTDGEDDCQQGKSDLCHGCLHAGPSG